MYVFMCLCMCLSSFRCIHPSVDTGMTFIVDFLVIVCLLTALRRPSLLIPTATSQLLLRSNSILTHILQLFYLKDVKPSLVWLKTLVWLLIWRRRRSSKQRQTVLRVRFPPFPPVSPHIIIVKARNNNYHTNKCMFNDDVNDENINKNRILLWFLSDYEAQQTAKILQSLQIRMST